MVGEMSNIRLPFPVVPAAKIIKPGHILFHIACEASSYNLVQALWPLKICPEQASEL